MQGKTFTIISYKNKKFSLKKDWLATDKNDMPDWNDVVYYFFYDKEKKQGDQITCFSYTKEESHSKNRPQVIAVMTGYDYRQCLYKDDLDYFEGFKAGVEQLIG